MTSAVATAERSAPAARALALSAPTWLAGLACCAWAGIASAVDHSLAGWVALVPVLALLPRASVGAAAALGAGAMVAPALVGVSWIPGVLVGGFWVPLVSALGVWLVAAFALAPAGALLGASARRLPASALPFALGVGLLWFVAELSHASLLPGIGWIVLGAGQLCSRSSRCSRRRAPKARSRWARTTRRSWRIFRIIWGRRAGW